MSYFSVPLSDRYHLGGPHSLRGFDLHGVGPRYPHDNPQYITDTTTPTITPTTTAASTTTSTTGKGTATSTTTPTPKKAVTNTISFPHLPLFDKSPISPLGFSTGGYSKCNLLALLSIPVPLKATGLGARLFAFINLGGLGDYKDLASNITYSNLNRSGDDVRGGGGGGRRPFFGDIRASVGGGVAIPLGGVARVVSMSYLSYIIQHTSYIFILCMYTQVYVCIYILLSSTYGIHIIYLISYTTYYILY